MNRDNEARLASVAPTGAPLRPGHTDCVRLASLADGAVEPPFFPGVAPSQGVGGPAIAGARSPLGPAAGATHRPDAAHRRPHNFTTHR